VDAPNLTNYPVSTSGGEVLVPPSDFSLGEEPVPSLFNLSSGEGLVLRTLYDRDELPSSMVISLGEGPVHISSDLGEGKEVLVPSSDFNSKKGPVPVLSGLSSGEEVLVPPSDFSSREVPVLSDLSSGGELLVPPSDFSSGEIPVLFDLSSGEGLALRTFNDPGELPSSMIISLGSSPL